ncbi:hypothetical protein ACH6EH_04925 [Paenibacillus sp. JSM ZJ436]|uniref:Uncharacterized protein n=1 Tax=Paenibacillus algicola TaxID=2565926 RepID=A0A4P8XT39_9BACL|nr:MULTISPECIES: hypothetical protein [Paenibacillus]QCT03869.1 hypothetical protein E6C60_3158 [Paenibacillus algicola]
MSKKKVQESYQTPNEKYNEEFGQENVSRKVSEQGAKKVQESYSTPNEKYDAEFAEFSQTNNPKTNR